MRILATTDLHMHLTSRDYVTDKATQNPGLAGIATLIAQARAEANAQQIGCMLFDNGDLLQGTAMGDWLAQHPVTQEHPAIACLNDLGYDAIGVGNHDLDYGMPYLQDVAARLMAPMVASNLGATDLSPLTPAALIPCRLPATDTTAEETLQIGILSVLPRQTALWNHHLLEGVATVESAHQCLRAAIPALRARGADLIILLAHMGLDQNSDGDDTALPLAQIPGIDAMITGHTHRRFPGRDHAGTKGVSTTNSTVAQIPAVMPGHAGSDLAVLDLTIQHAPEGGWRVTQHTSALRRNETGTVPAPSVLAATTNVEHRLRGHLASIGGNTPVDLHNFFALAAPTRICALTARAKMRIARLGLQGRPEADLPLLAASSAHTAGGRDGPQNFLFIPKGPVLRRHLWGLNPYGNRVWVINITGAELKARLEHAATVYNQLCTSRPDQPLINPARPVFDFDTVFGVRYTIDPAQPHGKRISGLTYEGHSVQPDQPFLLATNQFRVAGGGGYAPHSAERVVLRSQIPLEQGLTAALRAPVDPDWNPSPWALRPTLPIDAPLSARLITTPAAERFLGDLAHLTPVIKGSNAAGFIEVGLTF